jgi:DDE domain
MKCCRQSSSASDVAETDAAACSARAPAGTAQSRMRCATPIAGRKAFFRKAIKSQQRCPQTITLDGYAASHRAVRELKADGSLPADAKLRSSRYLNNLIEQDHRGVKQRIAVMLGFKSFGSAAITIAGIELLHRIRKGQFRLGGLGVQGRAALQSGTRCFGPKVCMAKQGVLVRADYLHQSLVVNGNFRSNEERLPARDLR